MIRTFHITIKTLQELNSISIEINKILDELNADFVSMHELSFPKVITSFDGTLIVVSYKTK